MLLSVLVFSWGLTAAGTPAAPAKIEVVVTRVDDAGGRILVGRTSGTKPLRLGIEPGDSIDALTLEVQGAPGVPVRVLRRVTASVSVQNEGPHLDLIGFADVVHPALLAPATVPGARTFTLPAIRPEENEAKPVSGRALVDELKRRGKTHWVEQLAFFAVDGCCAGVDTSASRVDVEVQRRVGDGWKTVRRVVIDIPMGC